ncbi:triacylglycerol lipase 2-like isoform X2 [Macadamia integrifolia]|uniref:triacylglycerol lipase 2-like isoform X2 n=1 Tax=Macadamia integrifolia TaxID=60698 RepID=UPI001C4E94C7|nr:triacylglycerol lipase 2-like isoform X2 [Macadamia integrifolia]
MDLHLQGGFYRWSVVLMSLFVSVLVVVEPHHAVASSRRTTFTLFSGAPPDPPIVGLCESSIIIHGYQCQEFYVKTEDGYVLNMQRIPRGRSGSGLLNNMKQPVLLQHGVLVDGMTWVLNTPEQALPFILADSGFDVWIANTRGTRFSRSHLTLDASQRAYWNWSWDELVEYDLPATIDFLYRQTGQKIHYVGHSMGTLIALASFSEGKLVDKLKSAALLSPVAYLSHMTTAIGVLAARSFVGEMTKLMGVAEFNPKGKEVANLLHSLCMNPSVDCYDLMTSFTGKNCCLNVSTVDLFLKNEPQSTSTKNMVHLAQTARKGLVSKYDYEKKDVNMEHYGQGTPPIYNLSNVPRDLPLFLSYGGRDALSDVGDVELLLDSLKFHNGDKLTTLFLKDYAHADFIMAVNAKEMVYNALIAFFRRH